MTCTVPIVLPQKINSECAQTGTRTGMGIAEEQEGKAIEAKHMKLFGPVEIFWSSPQIIQIMKT